MTKNSYGGKILANCIKNLGVKTIFTVPGESFLPALNGLYDHKDNIDFLKMKNLEKKILSKLDIKDPYLI